MVYLDGIEPLAYLPPYYGYSFTDCKRGQDTIFFVSTIYNIVPIVKHTIRYALQSGFFAPQEEFHHQTRPFARCFLQCPARISFPVSSHYPTTNIGFQLCWSQQKSRLVSRAASFYKCPGYFYVVLDSL